MNEMAKTKEIKDFDLKSGVDGQEDLLIQDNGITKRIKASEFLNTVDLTNYVTNDELGTKGFLTESDIANKVDKVEGMGLSTNDYTDIDKQKLSDVETGANKYIHPNTHPATMIIEDSNHKFVTETEKTNWNNKSEFDGDYNSLSNKPIIPTKTSDLVNDSNFIISIPSEYVTETELNAKQYATETFVTTKIADASLSGSEVDLSGYATKDELNAKANRKHFAYWSNDDTTNNTDVNHKKINFTLCKTNGFVNRIGYDEDNDFAFLPTKATGASNKPCNDNLWQNGNSNRWFIARLGGHWNLGYNCGAFSWHLCDGSGNQVRVVGARLLYASSNTN